jgi:hypothetical protein
MPGDSTLEFFGSLGVEEADMSQAEVVVDGGGLRSFFLRFRGFIIRGRLFSE